MIRFSCKYCGKSLRADEGIVGRHSKCTACGKVTRVPGASTRSSGEKKRPVAEDDSVLANSDSFSDFDGIDMAFGSADRATVPRTVNVKESLRQSAPAKTTSEIVKAAAADEFDPVYKTVRRRQRMWPAALLAVASLVILFAVIWMMVGGGKATTPAPVVKTAFEQTPAAIAYENARADLKKSRRVLALTGDGFAVAKDVPVSELKEMHGLMQQADSLLNDGFALTEGNRLFNAGDERSARQWIEGETKRLRDLDAEVKAQTEVLKTKTYSKT